jgi:hypothetical protein
MNLLPPSAPIPMCQSSTPSVVAIVAEATVEWVIVAAERWPIVVAEPWPIVVMAGERSQSGVLLTMGAGIVRSTHTGVHRIITDVRRTGALTIEVVESLTEVPTIEVVGPCTEVATEVLGSPTIEAADADAKPN